MKRWKQAKKKKLLFIVFCVIATVLGGCSLRDTRIVLHTGLGKEEVFRMEGIACTLPEFMVYLTATGNRYEKVYGKKIFETSLGQITLEENMKEMVLAQLSQIKAMNLLAKKEKLELTKEEKKKAEQAAGEFYLGLTEQERLLLKAEEEVIRNMYEEYALAHKLYSYLIREVNPEVSDDEARTITVQHILVKTYSLNEKKEPVFFSEDKKKEAYNRAREALKLIKEGKDFVQVAEEYSEDPQRTYSFRKGEMDLDFETTAFNMAQGEISNILETEYGYHIIKCISTFDQEETDANKEIIVEKKREEAFERRYTSFARELTTVRNEILWKKISLWKEEEVNCEEFFSIYDFYFEEKASVISEIDLENFKKYKVL